MRLDFMLHSSTRRVFSSSHPHSMLAIGEGSGGSGGGGIVKFNRIKPLYYSSAQNTLPVFIVVLLFSSIVCSFFCSLARFHSFLPQCPTGIGSVLIYLSLSFYSIDYETIFEFSKRANIIIRWCGLHNSFVQTRRQKKKGNTRFIWKSKRAVRNPFILNFQNAHFIRGLWQFIHLEIHLAIICHTNWNLTF